MSIRSRLYVIFHLFLFYLKTLPIRVYRVFKVPVEWFIDIVQTGNFVHKSIESIFCILLLITDIFALPEIIMVGVLLTKKSLRPLSEKEHSILNICIKDKLPHHLILINSYANLLTNNGKFAFVSFLFIHSLGPMKDHTFAHELIHIWQYTRFGSSYIIKALMAQKSKEGYDYFGESHLMNSYAAGKNIMSYNFEQQGEILADYYALQMNKTKYTNSTFMHKDHIYLYFVESIRKMNIYRWY